MLKASDLKVDFTIQKIASFEITLFHPITVFPCVMNRHVPLEIAVNYACVKLELLGCLRKLTSKLMEIKHRHSTNIVHQTSSTTG